jgi:thymidylate kinase
VLVVIEGGDGCGKTTVAGEVARRLEGKVIAFPRDNGVTGPLIRDYLARRWWVDGKGTSVTQFDRAGALAFQSLQVANRMEVMGDLLAAQRGESNLVLARYWQSGWVYGQIDGLESGFLVDVHRHMAQAQVNILLDIDPEKALERQEGRGQKLERYEGKRRMAERVAALYRELWADKELQALMGGRWVTVDSSGPLEATLAAVSEAIRG